MNKVASLIFCFLSFTINAQVKKYTLLECVNIALEKKNSNSTVLLRTKNTTKMGLTPTTGT